MDWDIDAARKVTFDEEEKLSPPTAAPSNTPARSTPASRLSIDSLIEQEGAGHLAPVIKALYGQESGSGANNRTSVDGARSGMQVIPSTFSRFADKGWDINNEEHGLRAGIRYAKYLGDKFGNDPSKIAAGYFSGEGNVPRQGAGAFIRDTRDGNGKSVSGYVADIQRRLGPQQATAAPSYPRWAEVAAKPEYQSMQPEEQDATRRRYFVENIAPQIPTDQLDATWAQFDADSRPKSNTERVLDRGKEFLSAITGTAPQQSVMEGYALPGSPDTNKSPVIGMSEAGYNKYREQFLQKTPEQLQRLSAQGGVMGQLADRVLQEKSAYTAKVQSGLATKTDELAMTGRLAPATAEEKAAQPISAADFAKDLWTAIKGTPTAVAGTAASLTEGSDPTEVFGKKDWKDTAIEAARKQMADNASDPAGDAEYIFGITRAKLRNFPQQLSYSLLSMGAGLAAGLPTAAGVAATGVGAPAAPAAGYAAGAAAAGMAAYRMDTNGFLRDIRQSLDQAAVQSRGKPLTDEEFVKVAEKYQGLVQKHGLYEALPEAASQVFGFALGKAIVKNAMQGGLGALARGIGAAGLEFGNELGTETITQLGQHNTEVEAGTAGPDAKTRSFTSLKDIKDSAAEVLPDVLMLTGVMAGGAHVGGKAYAAAERKLAPGRVIGRELQNAVNGTEFTKEGIDQAARDALLPSGPEEVSPSQTSKASVAPAAEIAGGAGVATANAPDKDLLGADEVVPAGKNAIADELAQLEKPEATREEDKALGSEIAKALEPAYGSGSVSVVRPEALPDRSGDVDGRRQLGKDEYADIEQLGQLFGKRVVLFDSTNDQHPDAFVRRADNGTIYLNTKAADAAHSVLFGHELDHLMSREAPEIHKAWREAVMAAVPDLAQRAGEFYPNPVDPKTGKPLLTDEAHQAEIVADLMGNRFAEPEFRQTLFNNLAARSDGRTVLKKALDIIQGLIDKVKALGPMKKFKADALVSDLKKVRREAARALGKYVVMQQRAKEVQASAKRVASTPEFKKWFGGSKVVDEKGEPLVVYHGTGADFGGVFDTNGRGKTSDTGAFFSSSPSVADSYTGRNGGLSIPAYLSLQRVVVVDAGGKNWNSVQQKAKVFLPTARGTTKSTSVRNLFKGEWDYPDDTASTDDLARWARANGYDGLVVKNVSDRGSSGSFQTDEAKAPSDIYVAFRPEQIKSATGNSGTFDPTNPDITASARRGPYTTSRMAEMNRGFIEKKESTAFKVVEEDGKFYLESANEKPQGQADRAAAAQERPAEEPRAAVRDNGRPAQAAPRHGKPREGAVEVEGVHFSTGERGTLVGGFYGSGLKGVEAERIAQSGDPRLKSRIYFYVNEGSGVKPEPGVGSIAHRAKLSNVYDASADNDGLFMRAKGDMNAFESAVLDAGYDGYYTRQAFSNMGAAVLLGSQAVNVQRIGQGAQDRSASAVAPPPVLSEDRKAADVLLKSNNLPSGARTGPEWATFLQKAAPQVYAALERNDLTSWLAGEGLLYRDQVGKKLREAIAGVTASAKRVTETPEFKKWFGDSKVVDEKGEPLVVYHGTNADFEAFDHDLNGSSGQGSGEFGFFFDSSPANAARYVRQNVDGGSVVPVFVSLQNPLRVEKYNRKYGYEGVYSKTAFFNFIDDALENGHDGAIFYDVLDRGSRSTQFVAFRPEQIKSAIGNSGAFDTANPDITASAQRDDFFPEEFASKRSSVVDEVVGSSQGRTEKVRRKNVNSRGAQIAPTMQALRNFWTWFGDSDVIDDKGRPLVLFHSTNGDFKVFEQGRETTNNYGLLGDVTTRRTGIFLTANPEFSQAYLREGSGKNVMPVYASLQNVADLRGGISERLESELESAGFNTRSLSYVQNDWELFDQDESGSSAFADALKQVGYDGAIIYEDSPEGGSRQTTYIAFSPEQVKSASGNLGTFSPTNPDITASAARDDLTDTYAAENKTGVIVGARPGEFNWNPGSDGEPAPIQHPVQRGPRLEKIGEGVRKILSSKQVGALVSDLFGVQNLTVSPTLGSWQGKSEPSFVLAGDNLTFEAADDLSKLLGFAFAQDATVVTQPRFEPSEDEIPAFYVGAEKRLSGKQLSAILEAARAEGLDYTTTTDGRAVKFLYFGDEDGLAGFQAQVDKIADAAKLPLRDVFFVRSSLNEAENYTAGRGGEAGQKPAWLEDGGAGASGLFGRAVDHLIVPYARLVGSEGYRFSPDRFGERFGLTADQVALIRSRLRPKSGLARSTAPILTGEEKLEVPKNDLRAKEPRSNNTDILWALQNRAAQTGLIEPGDYSPEARKVIAQAIADEIIHHVSRPGGKSAIGWYDAALKRATDIYDGLFPEIANDPAKEMLFDAVLGITSQGNDVFANSLFAVRLYQLTNRQGMTLGEAVKTMAGSFGLQTRAIEGNLLKLEHLVNVNGYERMRGLFNEKKTVAEWNAILRRDESLYGPDGKPLSVEGAARQRVTGWMVFGPKIGSFINNLDGDYSTLTADLWFSRSWNRILGYSFIHSPQLEAKQYQRFKEETLAEHNGEAEGQGDLDGMTDREIDALLADPDAMLDLARDLEKKFREGQYKQKSDLRRAAKNWVENRDLSVAVSRSDHERAFQQDAMEDAQQIIKRKTGQKIEIADMQAALWYHEKELFRHFGASDVKREPADYADAAKRTAKIYRDGDLFYVDNPKPRYILGEKGDYLGGDEVMASARRVTETPEFKKWFGDSKVVDEKGEPLVVYHGTDRSFSAFGSSFLGAATGANSAIGFYFVARHDVAESYAHHAALEAPVRRALAEADEAEREGDWDAYDEAVLDAEDLERRIQENPLRGQNVIPVFLRLQNPAVTDAKGELFGNIEESVTAFVKKAKAAGKDGAVIKNLDDDPRFPDRVSDHYVVFRPEQIKSATGNNGAFNQANPDITASTQRDPAIVSQAIDRAIAREQGRRVSDLSRESATVKLRSLRRQLEAGKIDEGRFIFEVDQLSKRLDLKAADKAFAGPQKRVRGADFVRQKILEAKRNEDITAEEADFLEWFALKNPALLDDLGISVRAAKDHEKGAAGRYMPASRVMVLMRGATNKTTAVHETLHHLERLMPAEMQEGIRGEWLGAVQAAYREAVKTGDKGLQRYTELVTLPTMRSMEEAGKLLKDGKVDRAKYYQLLNASEFWAVRMTEVAQRRFAADSIWAKSVQWLREALEHIKGALGLRSDAPMLRALNDLLKNGDGKAKSKEMLGLGMSYEQPAWHGSPHKFDKFSLDAIGTGEGAQAYGWGLYFAGKKDVAEWYRHKLAGYNPNKVVFKGQEFDGNNGREMMAFARAAQKADGLSEEATTTLGVLAMKHRGDLPAVFDEVGSRLIVGEDEPDPAPFWQELEHWAMDQDTEALNPAAGGALYQVEIPEENEYLLWDKPLSEQPEAIQRAVDTVVERVVSGPRELVLLNSAGDIEPWSEFFDRKQDMTEKQMAKIAKMLGPGAGKGEARWVTAAEAFSRTTTGEALYKDLARNFGSDKAASEYLHSLGIAGIKYLDGTSRSAGEGSYNYVVFDDSRVEITDIQASVLRKALDARDNALRRLDAAVDGLANLPDQFDYLTDRYRTLGRIARVDEITSEIRKAFDGAGAADKQAVYDYLTNAGANANQIGPRDLRDMALRLKRTINYVGDQLVARGLLDPAVRAKFKDQYLPRMYLKHLMSNQDWKILGAGKKPSDMGYLKERKNIPEEVRELILGEVKDPAFLGANAIGRSMRDIAILDWLGKISQNGNWVFPGVMLDFKGQQVSAYYLKAEADRIEGQIPHYTPANQAKAKKLVQDMRDAARQALANLDVDHTLYKQIPDTHRYGMLRGLYVRKEIYSDIMGMSAAVNPDPTWFEKVFGMGHIGTKLTQYWKFTKVALNPPGQVRNFVSNMVMLQLSGVPLHKLPLRFAEAVRDIKANGPYWKVAKKYGVTESTFNAQELFRIKDDLLSLEAAGSMNPISWIKLTAAKVFEKASDAYQFTEALGKTMKIIDVLKTGGTEQEAAIEAQKWLFDYSLVPQWVRIARNSPVGMPFITYSIKVLPRLVEVATTAPWRLLPWVGLLYGMAYYAAASFGVDKDELDKLKKALPEWLQDKGFAAFLPMTDGNGRVQVLDASYFFPWTFYTDLSKHAMEGKGGKVLQDLAGMFSSPVIGSSANLVANYDSFTKKPIYNPADPPSYQAAAITNYLYDLMAPPVISSHGVLSPMGLVDKQYGGKLVQGLTGTTNKFGDPRATTEQALWSVLGVNFYGMDPEHTRATNLLTMSRKVQDAEARLKQKLYDRSLTEEQRAKAVGDYKERMMELGQEAKKYAEESQVPEKLKTRR